MKVEVDGHGPIDGTALVGLRVVRSLGLVDLVEAEIRDDAGGWQTRFAKVLPGAAMTVTAGALTLTTDLVRVVAKARPGRPASFLLVGLGPAHRLRAVRVSGVVEGTLADLVGRAAKTAGISIPTRPGPDAAEPHVLLAEPAAGLVDRAGAEAGAALAHDGKKVGWGPAFEKPARTVKLHWGWQVQGGVLDVDLDGVMPGVTVTGRDLAMKAVEHKAAASAALGLSGSDTGPKRVASALGTKPVLVPLGLATSTPGAAKARAIPMLRAAAERFVRVELRIAPEVELHPGDALEIERAPWPYNGPFRVVEVEWTAQAGEATEQVVIARSDALPQAPSAGGAGGAALGAGLGALAGPALLAAGLAAAAALAGAGAAAAASGGPGVGSGGGAAGATVGAAPRPRRRPRPRVVSLFPPAPPKEGGP